MAAVSAYKRLFLSLCKLLNGRIQHLWKWNRLVVEESLLEESAGQEQKGIIFQAV